MMQIKTTGSPFGMINIVRILFLLPYSIVAPFIDSMLSKATWIITNIPGPVEPFVVRGKKSVKFLSTLPGLADIPGGFTFVTHRDTAKASLTIDDSKCSYKEAKIIMETLEKTFDQFLKSPKPSIQS